MVVFIGYESAVFWVRIVRVRLCLAALMTHRRDRTFLFSNHRTAALKRMSQQVFSTQANTICPILALPVEIGKQVIQNVDSTADLHALSLSCKAFTEITREIIFADIKFTFPFARQFFTPARSGGFQETRLLGLSKMVTQTKYIKCITVRSEPPVKQNRLNFPGYMQETLAEWLRQMSRLERLVIEDVNLSECLILAILDTSSWQPLSLHLRRCPFSGSLPEVANIPLHISELDIQSYSELDYWDRPVDEYTVMERQSIATAERLIFMARFNITTLRVDSNSPLGLTEMLGSISLPSLCVFEWNYVLYEDEQLPAVMDSFLQRHSTITSISLAGDERYYIPFSFPSLTKTPPSLPNLQIIKATSNFIHQLVPGRPVVTINMICVEPSGFTSGVHALYHSTSTITKASLVFSSGNDTWEQVIGALAEATPALQYLDLRTTSPALGIEVCTNR